MITVDITADTKPTRVKSLVLKEFLAGHRAGDYTKEQVRSFLKDIPHDSIENVQTFVADYDITINVV